MKRLNVLIVAHEFSPDQGSECAEGWNLVTRIAKHHDVTVLYASGSQFSNDSYVKAIDNFHKVNGLIPGLKLININQPKMTNFFTNINKNFVKIGSIGLPVLYFLGYKYWQKEVYKKAKQLNDVNNFDISHQLTQITFREPGYLWNLNIPFVWGPTGGTSTIPKGFLRMLTFKSLIFEKIRTFSNFYQFNYVSRIIQANKRAALIYCFTNEDGIRFKKRATGKIKLMLDAGTSSNKTNNSSPIKNESSVITGIWCGQLIERKAPLILLNSLALGNFSKQQLRIIIIGSGPLESSLHKLAKELKIENVEWISKVSHDKIFGLMSSADFFIHTSYREATSNVIPEALSMGLPVICHDSNGMSIAINENCGIKIPLISYEESVKGFYQGINSLLLDRDLLNMLKKGANKRSQEISWDTMAETIAKDYNEIYNINSDVNLK
jgi:glycosyltransferase involved in cell wall biosynthesis